MSGSGTVLLLLLLLLLKPLLLHLMLERRLVSLKSHYKSQLHKPDEQGELVSS